MKRSLLSLFFLGFSGVMYAQTPCTSENFISLGDTEKLSHTYYNAATNTVFGVGYFTDTVTVGTVQYYTSQGFTGKYIVELDTAGAILNSFQVASGVNLLEKAGGKGFFEPGIGLSDLLIVPNVYINDANEYIFQVQAMDYRGTIRWDQRMTASPNFGLNYGFDHIKISPTGDIILTGVYGDKLTFGLDVFTSGTSSTGFVLILNPDGTFKSITQVTGSGQMELFGLTTDDLGNIYVSGNAFKTQALTIGGKTVNYRGSNSAFLFKTDAAGQHVWTRIFESNGSAEPKAIKYDRANNYIHYVSTDYESKEKGSKLGALHADSGTVAWERTMVVPGWYYISYSSWIDYTDNSIYYSVWGKSVTDIETSLQVDGLTIKERINTNTYLHKYSLTGVSQYISPSRFTSIGEIAMVNPGKIFMQANYKGSGIQNISLGIFNPKNYPIPFGYLEKEGAYISDNVTFYASSDKRMATYQWLVSGDALFGETDSVFRPTRAGTYSVQISDGTNCPVITRSYDVKDGPTLQLDSLVLVELYNNTQGATWLNSTNWLKGNVATWYGVTVVGGRVTELFLANNNMVGRLPESIDLLTGLQQLFIQGNNISGTIPSSFWGLTSLVNISLHDNVNLKWQLHHNIQNLTALESIRAFNTQLTGVIPPEIGKVLTLRELWLSEGSLKGGIPPELYALPALTLLDLTGNPIGGTIRPEITNLAKLQIFRVGRCKLTGLVPDELWQLPNLLEIVVRENVNLEANLPGNLEKLIQLKVIDLANTNPMATKFPEDLYSLINLTSLDLGGHQLTGSLTSQVSNWKSLNYIWLWSNNLEGAIPTELASLPLVAAGFNDNNFTGIPTFDPTSMVQLEVLRNFLGFDDISRNLKVRNFAYNPQKKPRPIYLTVDQGGTIDLKNDYTTTGNQYAWVLNQNEKLASGMNHTITSADFRALGSYFCLVTNPNVPDLTIETASYNVAFSGLPLSFTVDNSPNSLADFKSFYAATYGTNDHDTLYVSGSLVPYETNAIFEMPRVIYGPGYFLNDNPETQASPETARISGIYLNMGSENSAIYGLDVSTMVLNQTSYIQDTTLRNITIAGNRISNLQLADNCQNIFVNKNYIENFSLASTHVITAGRSYSDIAVKNNIIRSVTTTFAEANAFKNKMENVVFDYNTIEVFTDSIRDAVVTNNYIDSYEATGNTASNNFDFTTAAFENKSGTLTIDNDYIPTNTSINVGAFSGIDAYILSGIPQSPHLYELTNTGRIRLNAKGKTAPGSLITSLHYRLGQAGTRTAEGKVKRLEEGNLIDVLFRPMLGNVVPGQTYDLMLWAKDNQGRNSIHQKISFTAETTTASGTIFSSENIPVTDGAVLLFEINQEGTAFDTLVTALNSQGGFTFSNIVIGDYLALGSADHSVFEKQLPTYFKKTDLWEEADTLLLDLNNTVFDITLIPEPKPTTGSGKISGFLEEEFEEENSGARLMRERRRVANAGVSVRRAVRTSRASEVVYVLVAYVYTDENGQFDFSNLPADNYRLNIQYPGYPMSKNNIDITIGENSSNNFTVEALVAKGEIAVAVASVTGLLDQMIESVNVYPNPVSNEGVTVEFVKDVVIKGAIDLQLFDITGNKALEKKIKAEDLKQNKIHLPFFKFKKGTYLLKIYQDKNDLGTVRLVVQ